jgi:hypothetical protein
MKATANWKAKAQELRSKYKLNISVSDCLERVATEQERAAGLDLADFLVRNAPSKAAAPPQPATPKATAQNRAIGRLPKTQGGVCYGQTFAPVWEDVIKEPEAFFDSRKNTLSASVRVHDGEIDNVPLFIESHLARGKAHNSNPTFKPYLDRLEELKNLLTN